MDGSFCLFAETATVIGIGTIRIGTIRTFTLAVPG